MIKEIVYDAQLKTEGFSNSMKGLQQELSKLKSQLGNNLLSEEDRNQILLRMGAVKGELTDMKYAISNIDPGDTFGNIATAMKPVVSGFGALTSAAVLFGGENKKLAEAQAKILAVIQVTQALQEVADTKRIKALYLMYAQSIKDLFIKKSATVAIQAETVATEGATIAQEGLNVAMTANPIGAVIALVAALVTGVMLLTGVIGDETEEVKKNTAAYEDLLGKMASQQKAVKLAVLDADLASKKITQFEYNKMKAVLESTDKQTQIKEDARKAWEEIDKQVAAGEISAVEGNNRKLVIEKIQNDALLAAKIEGQTTIKKITDDHNKEILDKDKQLHEDQIEEWARFQKQKADGTIVGPMPDLNTPLKEFDINLVKQASKNAEVEKTRTFEAGLKKRTELTDQYRGEQARIIRQNLDAEEEAFKEMIKKMIADIRNMAIEGLGNIISQSVSSDYKQQIDDMNRAIEDQYTKEGEGLDNLRKRNLITETEYTRRKEELEKKKEEAVKQARIKEWKLNQEAAITEVAIQTAVGVAKAIAQNPMFGGLPGSAIALAQGLIQTAIIKSQKQPKFQYGGLVPGQLHSQGGTILEAERGEYIVNRFSTLNNLPTLQALNGQNNDLLTSLNTKLSNLIEVSSRPMKAYVLEAEISDSQKRIFSIKNNSTF